MKEKFYFFALLAPKAKEKNKSELKFSQTCL